MPADRFDQLCELAKECLDVKDWEQARPLLQQALALRPDSPDLHYNLASVCFQLDDLPAAALHFRETTRLDPLRAGAYINLGAVYNLLDELDRAIDALRRGLHLDPHRAEGYYNLGLVHRRKGQKDLAIQAYREAIRVEPRMADAHYNLGNLLLDQAQYGQAAGAYKMALKLRPNWDRARQGLEKAQLGLTQMETSLPASPPSAVVRKAETSTPTGKPHKHLDPELMLNPNVHGTLLTNLHKATIESETYGRHFLKVLESEVEPAIKELSTCLLYPDSPSQELGHCVTRFEHAMSSMRGIQRDLQNAIERIRHIGEKLTETDER
jgi:tetratricopeptide (TPR) repeat protein